MKSKAIPHMILAVILALVAGGLTIRWLASFRGQPGPAKPAPVARKVEALVAARAIPKGARLDAHDVRCFRLLDSPGAPVGTGALVSQYPQVSALAESALAIPASRI